VTLHLQNFPAEDASNEYDWLKTALTTTNNSSQQSFGRAELGVAGIKVEVEKLLAIKQVTKDWKPWNCVCCINCGMSLYAYDVSKPNILAVNQNLMVRHLREYFILCWKPSSLSSHSSISTQKSQEEIDKLAKSSAFSPTFKIVLEDEVRQPFDVSSPWR